MQLSPTVDVPCARFRKAERGYAARVRRAVGFRARRSASAGFNRRGCGFSGVILAGRAMAARGGAWAFRQRRAHLPRPRAARTATGNSSGHRLSFGAIGATLIALAALAGARDDFARPLPLRSPRALGTLSASNRATPNSKDPGKYFRAKVRGSESMSIRGFAAACGVACVIAVLAASLTAPARADDIESKAQGCGVCHGANGVPVGPTIPVIWGQQESYLVKEIHDYRAGDRDNAMMAPMARNVAPDDTRKIAAWFAAKPWPAAKTSAAAPPDAIADKIAMCKACHQPNFEGGPPAPRLAGLSYEYLRSTMNAFANGKRTNNLDMPGFMKALTDSERDAMAKYLAGL